MKGMDPGSLLARARQMKEEMARLQDDLAQRMVEGKAGDGAVSVIMSATQEIQAVRIKPEAVDPDDLEMLEDLVLLAVKQAQEKARALHDAEMGKLTGGMPGLPGLF